MSPSLQNIQSAFMVAMSTGYAMNDGRSVKKTTIVELPSSKVITSDDGTWKVVDCYLTGSDSGKSAGSTMIWYKAEPVWTMSYGGEYAKAVIPFLKKCLQQAYVQQQFYGGRGPEFVEEDPFVYVNRFHGTFSRFKGEERIYDKSGVRYGNHWYQGMSLIK